MKNKKSKLLGFLTFLAWIGFGVSIVLMVLYLGIIFTVKGWDVFSWFKPSVESQINKNIGDFLWGTLGISLTFTATVFLFVTFKEQRQQLEISREETDKIRFETTYFNILSMLKQVQDTVNNNIASHLGSRKINNIIEYYAAFRNFYEDKLQSDPNLASMATKFNPIEANVSQTEQYRDAIAGIYEQMIKDTDCNIGYLYRYLFNAIRFVVDDPYNKENKTARERYLNLLQAQLSNEELCLLFYNCISKYGENKDGKLQFRQILDENNFLENIDKTFLLNENQYRFYPHTYFKFLNRAQLSHVQTVSKS